MKYCSFTLVALFCLVQASNALAQTQVSFKQTRRDFYTPNGAVCMALGDFNRDGNMDIAVGSGSSIDLLFGNRDGTFAPAVSSEGASNAFAIAVGDFNGDGIPDVAASLYAGSEVTILLGKGNGRFVAARTYDAGGYPPSLVADDFNHDGKIDLAAADQRQAPGVSLQLGNGDGTFRVGGTFDCGTFIGAILTADFNHDGHADLASLGETSVAVSILMGDGAGRIH